MGREVILDSEVLSKSFSPPYVTSQPSLVINKFDGEELWGLDSHRNEPSGENEELALNWWVENGEDIPQLQIDPLQLELGSGWTQ